MPLHEIIKTIEEEAKKQVFAISKETEEKITRLSKEYDAKILKKESEILNIAKNKIKSRVKKEKFILNTKEANFILEKKWEIINKIYDEALKKLKSMSDTEKIKLFSKLLETCPSEGEIIATQDDKEILKKLKGEKHKISDKKNYATGGFVFKSDKLSINNSFENLIASVREETEIEVGKILFKK